MLYRPEDQGADLLQKFYVKILQPTKGTRRQWRTDPTAHADTERGKENPPATRLAQGLELHLQASFSLQDNGLWPCGGREDSGSRRRPRFQEIRRDHSSVEA